MVNFIEQFLPYIQLLDRLILDMIKLAGTLAY